MNHDDVIKWKHFPRYWPIVRGNLRSPVNSPHKGQWRGAFMFSLICANSWANNRDAGDLRRHHAHYDVVVITIEISWYPLSRSPERDFWRRICGHGLVTHKSRVTHVCISKPTTIGSDNGLSPNRHQAIIWTNAGILLSGHWGTNFNKILIAIRIFSFKKMHLKMSSGKWRPFCLGLIMLSDGLCEQNRAYLGFESSRHHWIIFKKEHQCVTAIIVLIWDERCH